MVSQLLWVWVWGSPRFAWHRFFDIRLVSLTFTWKLDNNKRKQVPSSTEQQTPSSTTFIINWLISCICRVSCPTWPNYQIAYLAQTNETPNYIYYWHEFEPKSPHMTPLTIPIDNALYDLCVKVSICDNGERLADGVFEMKITYLRLTGKKRFSFSHFPSACNAHSPHQNVISHSHSRWASNGRSAHRNLIPGDK